MKTETKRKLDEIRAQKAAVKDEAQKKWEVAEEAKEAFHKAGEDANDPTSEAFKSFDETGKAYDELKEKLAGLDRVEQRLMELASSESPGKAADDAEGAKDERRDRSEKSYSPGERVTDSDEYKAAIDAGVFDSSGDMGRVVLGKAAERDEVKSLLTLTSATSAGAFLDGNRLGGMFALPQRPIRLLDLITIGATDSKLVEYVQQTAIDNQAAEVVEASDLDTGTKPQSGMDFELVQAAAKIIANWMPATRSSLSDVPFLRTLVESQLTKNLHLRTESQIVSGLGTGEDLRGILNTSGINSIGVGAGSIADKIHKGITEIRLDFLEPTGIGIHPTDWETVRLSRDDSGATVGTGGYLFGPPSIGGGSTMWGLPVVPTVAVPLGTPIVGDWSAAMLWIKDGVQVLASDSHSDFFIKNLIAVLAEYRAAFGIPIPASFCKVETAQS